MPWSPKTKILNGGNDEEIQTPAGEQILVGSPEDEVLLYQRAYTDWDLKTKISAGAWSLKTKIEP